MRGIRYKSERRTFVFAVVFLSFDLLVCTCVLRLAIIVPFLYQIVKLISQCRANEGRVGEEEL